jgi:hypothetical protein
MRAPQLTEWIAEHRVDGKLIARLGRRAQEVVAEFPSLGILVANTLTDSTYFEPCADAEKAALEKLHAGVLDALKRHIQGKLTFHAGAVAIGTRAVAFIGASGSGKSTLVAAMCTLPEIKLVADDTVAVEVDGDAKGRTIRLIPTQSSAWLLPDACQRLGVIGQERDKVAVPLPSVRSEMIHLQALVGLVFDDNNHKPILERVRGQEAFAMLAGSTIRMVVDDPSAQLREFDQLSAVARQSPTFRLRRRRDLVQLNETVDLIRQLFDRDEASQLP